MRTLRTSSNVTGIKALILLQILTAVLLFNYLRRAFSAMTDNVDMP